LRSGGDKRRLRGYEKRSRACALCAFFCARIFAPLETLARFLHRGAKTPQTLMLCEMPRRVVKLYVAFWNFLR
jgi:hypothetical protein